MIFILSGRSRLDNPLQAPDLIVKVRCSVKPNSCGLAPPNRLVFCLAKHAPSKHTLGCAWPHVSKRPDAAPPGRFRSQAPSLSPSLCLRSFENRLVAKYLRNCAAVPFRIAAPCAQSNTAQVFRDYYFSARFVKCFSEKFIPFFYRFDTPGNTPQCLASANAPRTCALSVLKVSPLIGVRFPISQSTAFLILCQAKTR